jgi:hypothetical protein
MDAEVNQILAHPQRAVEIAILAIVAAVFAAVFMRRALRIFCGIAIFALSFAVIIGGVAILMNDVSLSGPPGPLMRLHRFLTVDWAATSDRGDGAAPCEDVSRLLARAPEAEPRREARRVRHAAEHSAAEPRPGPSAVPGAGAAANAGANNEYPELIRRSYPGIPPERLFQVAASTVAGLPGWQVVRSDPKTFTLDAVYSTRVFGFIDDVRIVVTPRDEIDVCARSRVGEPGDHLPLGFFRGDFGANIGHVKEVYAAMGPATDEAYRQVELERAAKAHGVRVRP